VGKLWIKQVMHSVGALIHVSCLLPGMINTFGLPEVPVDEECGIYLLLIQDV
jgi:hypothetical protein